MLGVEEQLVKSGANTHQVPVGAAAAVVQLAVFQLDGGIRTKRASIAHTHPPVTNLPLKLGLWVPVKGGP
jgi:hypothetical protein